MKTIINLFCILGLLVGVIITPFASQAAPQAGTVSGTATYEGSHNPDHEVLVAAHLNVNSEPVASVHIWGPGGYALVDLPDGSYYVSAFLDIHDRGEGPPEFGEPYGWYDSNGDGNPDPVTVSGGDISGIDILMEDITDEYIQGTACYLGGINGLGSLEVALHPDPGAPPHVSQYLSKPCDEYIFHGGPPGTYYVSLLYDVNDSGGPPDPGEPIGWYDANGDGNPDPIVYTGNVITDVNITIGGIHYVDFSAVGNDVGTSWENAYHNLQDALTAAEPGEEIWVASGIYTPGFTREASFVLKHGVAVYGGFNGTETYRSQRNWRANTTVLSGEIGNPSIKTDNVYHVVQTESTYQNPVDETTILDGFTIMGGYADGLNNPIDKGGGFLNEYGYPTLVNLNFIDNYALNHGGAIASQYNDQPLTVINSTFSGNSATHNAGGIANIARVVVVNCSFISNSGNNGGGIVGISSSRTEIHNTILWGNQGSEIALQGTSVATATYSIVEGGFPGGTHILTDAPLFVDADGPDDVYGTLDDDLHLQANSPAIDAGDNTALLADVADSNGNGNTIETTPFDIDGTNRLINEPTVPDTGNGSSPLVDMGADEFAVPLAIAGLSAATSSPTLLGETMLFSARVISGTHITYDWDFGDSASGTSSLPVHTYATAGVYPVVLTATNSLGSQQTNTNVVVYESVSIIPGSGATTSDGTLIFQIPASITNTLTFTYTPQISPTQSLGDFEFGGLVFQLQATDENDTPIIEPGTPITLTIHYDESTLPPGTNEEDLDLHRFDEDSEQWVALTVLSRDVDNDTITVLLDHFSEFALLFVEPEVVEFKISLPLIIQP
jgi:predicted outer membrane repeat protein